MFNQIKLKISVLSNIFFEVYFLKYIFLPVSFVYTMCFFKGFLNFWQSEF